MNLPANRPTGGVLAQSLLTMRTEPTRRAEAGPGAPSAGGPVRGAAVGGGGRAALGNSKRSVSTPPTQAARDGDESFRSAQAKARRSGRYRMRQAIGELLGPTSNIARCGTRARPDGEGGMASIEIRLNNGSAYYSGVLYCGSPWMCSVCAPKNLLRRGDEIDHIVEVTRRKGGTVLFATLNCRHYAFDKAAETVELVSGAFGKLLAGRAWYGHSAKEVEQRREKGLPIDDGLRGQLGYVGMSRGMEISYGANGHHPHIHAMLVFDRHLTDDEITDLEAWLFEKWNGYLEAKTGRTIKEGVGVDVRRWDTDAPAGWYVTKVGHGWTLGSEMTAGYYKDAYGTSKNPAQLARQYVNSLTDANGPDHEAGRVLKEIWEATKGRPLVYTSPNLRKWAGLTEPELTDEEIANDDVGGEAVATLDERVYWVAHKLNAHADLLTATETGALDGLLQALADYGLPVTVVPRLVDDGSPPTISLDHRWWRTPRNN